jgi:hypothetical protein
MNEQNTNYDNDLEDIDESILESIPSIFSGSA